ncbi:unnamed protein product [Candida verbasci]|uniref:P-type Cu(+) transporter n=1 Tax=Candida verbasci TaxID=1227364 RepID=A0A9W4U0B3_9ASCO|nr:unnamed protein product [Candida verbasci]
MAASNNIIYKIIESKLANDQISDLKDYLVNNYSDLKIIDLNNEILNIEIPNISKYNEISIINDIKQSCNIDLKLQSTSVSDVKTTVLISGMTCGACSSSITNNLEDLPGVFSVSISLVTEMGLIVHSPALTEEKIISIIEDCGFDAKIQKRESTSKYIDTIIGIQGMTCGACSSSITNALEEIEGVNKVSVSLITEEALITHDESVVIDLLKETIEDCGFNTIYIKEAKNEQQELEEVVLKIVGIHDSLDLNDYRYNVEAYLNSLPGISTFEIKLRQSKTEESTAMIIDEIELNDELKFMYNPTIIGIRDIVDGLENIEDSIEYIVVNSIDQSSESQMNLLSKVKEIKYWTKIFIHCLVFGIPVVILSHSEDSKFWKNLVIFKGLYLVSLIELVLSTYIQFSLGWKFLIKFISFITKGFKGASMDVLICISTMTTYIFSVLSIVSSVWYGKSEKPPKVLFDTLVMLIAFVSFGKLLENKAKGATSTALSSLLSLTPSTCTIIDEQYVEKTEENKVYQTKTISIDLVQPNDIAMVLPGGKIPADGIIVFGETEIDESLITGEPLPIHKGKGDVVIGGSINGPYLIHLKITHTGKRSQLQQIINLVKDSQINKAPVQRFSDYIAARFVPSIIILSLITFTIWFIICYTLHPDKLPKVFQNEENGKIFVCLKLAISVIVVACPCALGLAAPTAVMVGTGVGARNGVLIKGADILEKSTSINILLFDKTGTLTTGEMSLVKQEPKLPNGLSMSDWWTLIGSLETNSEHPVGKALTKIAKENLNIDFEDETVNTVIKDVNIMIGLGIQGSVQIRSKMYNVTVGNHKLISEKCPNLEIKSLDSSNTLCYVFIDDEYSGYVELSDTLKKGSWEVINYLKNAGYIIGMVTGDNKGAAIKIGKEVGISENNIFYEVSPINKDKVLTNLKTKFPTSSIAFIGDGINDAPALAKADIGMAISSGTDIAIESADIVLMNNLSSDLMGVVNALQISNKTFNRIKLNFLWAILYNILMLPFAMGCFLPLNIVLPPVAASIAMMFSSLSVVFNSLLLKNYKAPKIEINKDRDYELGNDEDQFNLKNGTREEFENIKRKNRVNFSGNLLRRQYRNTTLVSNSEYELISGR